jgi:hypothetical protein
MNEQSKTQNTFITCKDGLTMSVQASKSHYCDPQDNEGPYRSVEVGYPSVLVPELIEYAEGYDLTGTVYGFVPLELVRQVIYVRGGLLSGELPPHVETQINLETIK